MNLIIDFGNYSVKVAVFDKKKIIKSYIFKENGVIPKIIKIIKEYSVSEGIVSNVSSFSDFNIDEFKKMIRLTLVNSKIKLPFINKYKTLKTLGADRIALVCAAVVQFSKKHVLIIDSGSCITFDFVNSKREYLGGAISPGIEMRFKALNKYTANLPLLEKEELKKFIGTSTKENINSGVINGVIQEIMGVINQYKKRYKGLNVILTGGDASFLSKQLKSSIFVNQNLLFEGLNELLIFNQHK